MFTLTVSITRASKITYYRCEIMDIKHLTYTGQGKTAKEAYKNADRARRTGKCW